MRDFSTFNKIQNEKQMTKHTGETLDEQKALALAMNPGSIAARALGDETGMVAAFRIKNIKDRGQVAAAVQVVEHNLAALAETLSARLTMLKADVHLRIQEHLADIESKLLDVDVKRANDRRRAAMELMEDFSRDIDQVEKIEAPESTKVGVLNGFAEHFEQGLAAILADSRRAG